jgi:hypothetical protein
MRDRPGRDCPILRDWRGGWGGVAAHRTRALVHTQLSHFGAKMGQLAGTEIPLPPRRRAPITFQATLVRRSVTGRSGGAPGMSGRSNEAITRNDLEHVDRQRTRTRLNSKELIHSGACFSSKVGPTSTPIHTHGHNPKPRGLKLRLNSPNARVVRSPEALTVLFRSGPQG